jgi:putative oxidoreductase
MNRLAPYAAFFMRLAVGGVFLQHGIQKFNMGIPSLATFVHGIPIPFASLWAVYLTVVETVGAACVLLGIFTRFWAVLMAANMAVAILAVRLPRHEGVELELLLLAGAVTLVALGDGPLSVAIGFKRGR